MDSKKLTVRDLCAIAMFTALISVSAQLAIPMPYGVPMTLQTLAIPLAGIVLGAKKGTVATLVYIALGAVGAPVFSSFRSGLSVIIGPTGGFIYTFPLMTLAAGLGERANNKPALFVGLIVGAVINYLGGMLHYSVVMSVSIPSAFTVSVLPFLPTGVIKIILAAFLGRSIKYALVKSRVLT